jgi:hypothetical protein
MFARKPGSLLLDAIIALGISSFIILSITTVTTNTLRSLKEITKVNNSFLKITQTTNQLFKDFSSLQTIKSEKEPEKNKTAVPDEDKKTKKEDVPRALFAESAEDWTSKINKKEYHNIKLINGITTTSLKSPDENKPALVRFSYKLIKQTLQKPFHTIRAFKLYRKETANLDDLNLKNELNAKAANLDTDTEWILICDNIADCIVQFATFAPAKKESQVAEKNTKKATDDQELVESFDWPNKKLDDSYKLRTPTYISVILRIWNSEYTKTIDKHIIIPCLSWTSCLPAHDLTKKAPGKSGDDKKQADQKTTADSEQTTNQGSSGKIMPTPDLFEKNQPTVTPTPQTGRTPPRIEHETPEWLNKITEHSRPQIPTPPRPAPQPIQPQMPQQQPPADIARFMDAFSKTPLGKMSDQELEAMMVQTLPPEVLAHVYEQARELERNPDKMYAMMRGMM